ncbi:MAG: ABC transporter permease [Candidatus Zixiibacteriota bacterium]|nr:MAG: ABC transporter permease [candidate division Zixibacteria bacterium]
MLSHYLKIAFRNILRRKLHTTINVLSLTLGLTCCVVVLLWVQSEIGYDSFHANADQLYLVARGGLDDTRPNSALCQEPLAPALKAELGEISEAVRFSPGRSGRLIRYRDRRFQNDIVARADPAFLEMFTFPLAVGDPSRVLSDPSSAVISESMVTKYFGSEDPIGKSLNINGQLYIVSGVMLDIPEKSTIQFDCLLSFESRSQWLKDVTNNWDVSAYLTYLQLADNVSVSTAATKMNDLYARKIDEVRNRLYLVALKDIHLHESNLYSSGSGAGIKYVYFFSITAFSILLLGCINFANLTTAQSSRRSREIGVRKVIGARRTELARQFLMESILMTTIAALLALTLGELVIPWFSSFTGKHLLLGSLISSWWCLGLLVLVGWTGVMAGGYPALILSALKPVQMLKGFIGAGKSSSLARRLLVVVQYVLCILAIIGVICVYQQLSFVTGQQLGFDKENMLVVWNTGEFGNQYSVLKNELLAMEGVEAVTGGTPPMDLSWATKEIDWEGRAADQSMVAGVYKVDFNYISTMGIDLVDGRDFSLDHATDLSEAFILNETAIRELGLADPIGASFTCEGRQGRIIGAVKDFDFQSAHSAIGPLVIQPSTSDLDALCIRIRPEHTESIVAHLEKRWLELSPDYPYEFEFLDDAVDSHYDLERRISTILTLATGIGMIVASLGLLGLATFTAQAKTKEIGIRKVMGASPASLVRLLCREFVILVAIANVIAWPIGYWGANRWLESFAYRFDLDITVFLLSGGLALALALLTVSFQAVKSARANPVEALKCE